MMRTFLFLQGPHGPFFAQLGARLRQKGCRVIRINFNGGDILDWPWPNAVLFRGRSETWPGWVKALAHQYRVTDLVLYGDCRPLHRTAIAQLRLSVDMRVHVFEEGYLRPDWVTLEHDGVNGYSSIYYDPGCLVPESDRISQREPTASPLGSTIPARIRLCIQHYLAMAADRWLFPHYRTHRPYPVTREVAGWLRRGLRLWFQRDTFKHHFNSILADSHSMFLLPLQLDSDAQVCVHSPFGTMTTLIEHVIGSFVNFAPLTARLVIKNHPFDNGVTDYSCVVARAAAKQGAADRIVFLEGGHLPTLLKRAQGVIVVNSTAGLQAIHHGRPTKALGKAVYALPGLVDTAPLDAFWRDPKPPSAKLYWGFRAFLMSRCQLHGSFFTRAGRMRLLPQAAGRLMDGATYVPRGVSWKSRLLGTGVAGVGAIGDCPTEQLRSCATTPEPPPLFVQRRALHVSTLPKMRT